MRRFIALSAGILASVTGSAFTDVALSVWVFRNTGSATQFGISLILSFLPGILVGPLAGALIDRWNRRLVLICTSAASGAVILGVALLSWSGALVLWQVFLAVALLSILRALQMPALYSAVVLLVPAERVGQANGLIMLAQALGSTMGFAAGGLLLDSLGLTVMLLIDVATFAVNVVILLLISIPQPPPEAEGTDKASPTTLTRALTGEIRAGWQHLADRRLVPLMIFYGLLTLGAGVVDALITPLVLSFAGSAGLGLVIAALGVGMAVGGVVLSTWGGPRRRIGGLAGFALPMGFLLMLGAVQPSIPLIMIAACGFMFCLSIVEGTTVTVLQLQTDPGMQGRVFATHNMVTNSVLCAAYAIAGPLVDYVFEPLLAAGGALADSVGAVIGVGPGRGMAFLIILLGGVLLVTAVTGYLHPSLRRFPDRGAPGKGTPQPDDADAPQPDDADAPQPEDAVAPLGARG